MVPVDQVRGEVLLRFPLLLGRLFLKEDENCEGGGGVVEKKERRVAALCLETAADERILCR